MAAFRFETFEGSSSLPANLNAQAGWTIDQTSKIVGANTLANLGGASLLAMFTDVGPTDGNVIADADFLVDVTTGTNTLITMLIESDLNDAATTFGSGHFYYIACASGSGVTSWSINRRDAGTNTQIATMAGANQILKLGARYHLYLQRAGAVISASLKQISDPNNVGSNGQWLNSSVAWQTARTTFCSGTDGAPLATGVSRYSGVRGGGTGVNLHYDNFRLSDLSANAVGYTLSASPGSVTSGSPSTITATLTESPTGGTALSSSLVITLVDDSTGTISGTITIANGSTTGTATVTPTATGTHNITATHTGGGFTGSDGSTSFTATASTNATGYTLGRSPGSVTIGSPVTITATLTGGTTLSASLVITLADNLAGTTSGTITITNGNTSGTATRTPSAVGTHNITATHTGGGFAGGDGSTSFAAVAATVTLPVNGTGSYISVGNVDVQSSSLAVCNYMGGIVRQGFTGTSIVGTFDTSALSGAGLASGQYPKIAYSVDGGIWQTVTLAATVSFATSLASGSHYIEVEFVSFDRSVDQWVTPASAARLTGWTIDSGATATALPTNLQAKSRSGIFWGNSMTAGIYNIAAGTTTDINSSDSRYSWAKAVGAALDMDVNNCAVGGMQYAVDGGNGGFPRFFDSTTVANSTYRKYSSGRTRASLTSYTDHFFNFGVIEASDPSSSVTASLADYRPRTTASSNIWVVIPFGGRWRSQITAAVASYKSTSGDGKVYVIDNGTKAQTGLAQTSAAAAGPTKQAWDGYHPNRDNQAEQGAMVVQGMLAATGTPAAATAYSLDFGTTTPVAGQRYLVTARLPVGTTLASDVTVTLAGTNLTYSATSGGSLATPGTLTISAASGTGSAYWSPTAAGSVAPSATNGGSLANPTISALTATAAPPVATSYSVVGIPSAPVVGQSYAVTAILNGPASALGVITPTAASGITWGSAISIASGANSGASTVTFTAAGTYTPAFTHTGLGFSGDPTLSSVTATAGGTAAANYTVVGIPSTPIVNTSYTIAVVLDNPASASGVVTFGAQSGITWGGTVTLAQGAVSGTTSVTFTAAGSYTPTATHSGLGFSGNPTLPSVTAVLASSGGTAPTAQEVADAVLAKLLSNTNGIPADLARIGGDATAAANAKEDFLANPATQTAAVVAGVTTATVNALGVLLLDKGAVADTPAPTTTTFSATGAGLTAGSGGYRGMNVVFQDASGNVKRTVTSHSVVGSRHDFVIDSANPLPTAPGVGDTFILG